MTTENTQVADFRYSTRNTNLAACIGSLKIPVKSSDPVSIVVDHDTGNRVVTFWFEDEGVEMFCGEVHKPRIVERHWDNREAFENTYPIHPLVFMRAALDKRDWLAHAWHGRIMPASSLDRARYRTTSIILASVLMASGYRLLRLNKPHYEFGKIPRNILEDFQNFERPGFIERPAALMRRALEARALLVAESKSPRVPVRVKFTDGLADAHAGKMAFVPEKASDEEVSKALDTLYRPQ